MELDRIVAIVTGGASGIGLATVKAFAKSGARAVVIADINELEGKNRAAEISSETACDVWFIHTDVSSTTSIDEMTKNTVQKHGCIDILVNNASICPVVLWDEATIESWEQIIKINLTGMYACTRSIIPYMKAAERGRIIFVASTAAFSGSYIAHPAYGVSKAGVINLMKVVAKNFSSYNILANVVIPGPIDTALSRSFTERQREELANSTLLKRYGKASEVADAILFLASPGSNYITGTTLQVSGGQFLV